MTDIVAQALNNPIFPAIGLALAATAGALWVAATWWAYRDASWRTGSSVLGLLAAAWIVLSSPLLLPLSLGVYALARPQHTAAEGRSRQLVRELVARLEAADGGACPTCASRVDPEWLRCPTCSMWLAQPCAHCGGWSDRALAICPWCGSDDRAEPAVEGIEPAELERPQAATRARRRRRDPVGVMAAGGRGARARLDAILDVRPPARAGG